MNEKNILNLIEKFEESLENTDKLTNVMMGLEGALSNLDNSITEVYELTKVEDLTKKSASLLGLLENLKNVQSEINNEYSGLINLNLYKENLKEDIRDLKITIKEETEKLENNFNHKLEESISEIKKEISLYKEINEQNNKNMKEEIIKGIKLILEENQEECVTKEFLNIEEEN